MSLISTATSAYTPPSTITSVFREDLEDTVYLIDPFATPIDDMLPKAQVTSTIVNWIIDTLPTIGTGATAGSMDNTNFDVNIDGISEGADASYTNYPSSQQPNRKVNFTQIFATRFGVSGTLAKGVPAGIRNVYNWEMLKYGRAIKKGVEKRWFDNPSANASYNAGATGSPQRSKTFHDLLITDASANNVAVNGNLTPNNVDTGLLNCDISGGEPEVLACSPSVKINFAQSLRQTSGNTPSFINFAMIDASERKAIRAIEFYEGPLGRTLAIVACRQIPAASTSGAGGRAYLFEKAKLGKLVYRPMEHIELGRTGDNIKGMLVYEACLKVANKNAHAVFTGVTA